MADVGALIRKRAEENKAWREAMEADRSNLSEMRDTALKEVTSVPEQYMSYLRLQADNIQCSAGNVVLTMYQLDGATAPCHAQAGGGLFLCPHSKPPTRYNILILCKWRFSK